MMTDQLQVSVLSAPLASIDRRALSQAWYSALQMARPSPTSPTGTLSLAHQPRAAKTSAKPSGSGVRTRVFETHLLPAASRRQTVRLARGVAIERRRERSPLAREIERTFLDPRSQVKRAAFTIENGARVHVFVQTQGSRTTLVALCPPRLRSAVARALAQARFALARRGIVVDFVSKGIEPCS
jgi:hypothetical protein